MNDLLIPLFSKLFAMVPDVALWSRGFLCQVPRNNLLWFYRKNVDFVASNVVLSQLLKIPFNVDFSHGCCSGMGVRRSSCQWQDKHWTNPPARAEHVGCNQTRSTARYRNMDRNNSPESAIRKLHVLPEDRRTEDGRMSATVSVAIPSGSLHHTP
ncbi:hypothetical protein RvY_00147-1 [Ramazzottius varieornatus]|uniref:Uncharacterized protein n=1 Tax=Ramazzottius varieornatus TaxID=947166 RepID=A0A1D1UJ57_RAMVA|nr:hypothetical protein RvY_00147-1 [Ramazzottius varieornatus]